MLKVINRTRALNKLNELIQFSPITAILGPRQSGKNNFSQNKYMRIITLIWRIRGIWRVLKIARLLWKN